MMENYFAVLFFRTNKWLCYLCTLNLKTVFIMPRILFLLLIVVLFSSCNRWKKGDVYIEGTHPTVKNKMVYLVDAQQSQGYTGFYKALDSAFADKNGHFVLQTKIKGSGFYQLRNHNEYMLWHHDLYLQAGDSITVTEAQLFTNTQLSTEINEFPARLQQEFPRQSYKWITMQPRFFIETIDKRSDEMQSYTEDFFATLEAPEEVKERYLKEIQLREINLKLDYLKHHNLYAYGQWHPIPLDSMKFDQPVKQVLMEEQWHYLSDYLNCIQKYLTAVYHTHFFNPLDANADHRVMKTKKAIIDTMFTGVQRDIALSRLAEDFWINLAGMQDNFYKDAEMILEYFREVKSSGQYFDFYKDQFMKFKRIEPGNPAPLFTLRDSSGQQVSLNTFFGNYIYITFWNTMNRPFVSNLDSYRKVSETFSKYDNVTLLFVALQPDDPAAEQAWKYFIKTYPFGEHHLIAPGAFDNQQIAPYMLNALPKHVLIDPEGLIITPRAPKPEELEETLGRIIGSKLMIAPAS